MKLSILVNPSIGLKRYIQFFLLVVIYVVPNQVGFAQGVRCSYLEYQIGYLYNTSSKTYKEEIKSYQRDEICMGPTTIAIGSKTSYYMGEAISRKEDKDGSVYRMKAKDNKGNHLILETSFTNGPKPKMVITALYPEAYYIVYYVE